MASPGPLAGWVSVAEAATQLGVEPEQVRHLAHSGALQWTRARGGQALLIEEASIARRKAVRPEPGRRPLSLGNAWAVLWLAGGQRPEWVRAERLTRVRRYLNRPLRQWPGLLSRRADVHRVRVPQALMDRVESLPGVCRGGAAAAIRHGAPLVDVTGPAASAPQELYLVPSVMARVRQMRGVGWESSSPNLLLRALPPATPSAVIEWMTNESEVSAAVAAADLLEQGEQRAANAAAALLTRTR